MVKKQRVRLQIGLEHAMSKLDGFPIVRRDDRIIDLAGMTSISKRRLQKILTDHRLFGEILQKYPKEISAIFSDILAGRQELARTKAESIGLTEKAFQKKSGGLIGWLIVVVIVIVIIATEEDAE